VSDRARSAKPLLWWGLSYDDLEEARWVSQLHRLRAGVEGECGATSNHVHDFDQYLQAQWDPDARWRLIAACAQRVDVTSHDHLPGTTGRQCSGLLRGESGGRVTFRASQAVNVYASYAKDSRRRR